MPMANIAASLRDFGADPTALRLFDDEGPELLPYATLLTARRGNETLGAVEAVYEWQGAPLIFLVDANSIDDHGQLHRIRRLLAMRGDAPYLGVLEPGRLDIYGLALDKKSPQQALVNWQEGEGPWFAALTRLGNARPNAAISQRNWISNVVLKLLTGSISSLIGIDRVSDEDAVSLVGRALFTRFIADRNLLPGCMSCGSSADTLFDSREAAERTSKWLDVTFNGDLLPLSADIFKILPDGAYRVLGDVLRRAPDGQLFLGWEERWGNLHFAHIPVGVLSQAYEHYLKNHAPSRQRRQGGYYTPRQIANLMVRAAFRALERRGSTKNIRILDPAAGGGVFLLTVFRELIATHWRATGERPDTNSLRGILLNQLVGFDINEAALRFAALGLYLMAIELDPDPRPVDKLRFDHLRGTVLHKVAAENDQEGTGLGSLGSSVGMEHVGQYDLVIGNPPWASSTKLANWNSVKETVARIATERIPSKDTSPPLPNEGLDLPFVWRAMEWAKPNGQIAFALHARLLFQQGDGMPRARQALFDALDVTSIINGAELRQTKVWPHVSVPFCILLATNRVAGMGAAFRFISPRIEESLNGGGTMRIDTANAELVATQQLRETPDILKILFRGTKADVGIIERIRAGDHPTLDAFWRRSIGDRGRGHLRGRGNGYQKLRRTSSVRDDGPRGMDARSLHGKPEITTASFSSVLLDPESVITFQLKRVHRIRSEDLFSGPLVIIHKSPSAMMNRIGVVVSDEDVVFNETFYGYSPRFHPDASLLVRYLALVLGSKLAAWLALVTSGEFGFEREVVEKLAIDRFPIPDFDQLSQSRRHEIARLIERVNSGDGSWDEVDEWIVRLYGLGPRDLKVIHDTLEFNLPFSANRQRAQEPLSSAEKVRFCKVLEEELTPWCERFDAPQPTVRIPQMDISPWEGIDLAVVRSDATETVTLSDWKRLLRVADEASASEMIIRKETEGLLIGRLAQRRYWSETQAWLLAQRIIWSHADVLAARARE